LFSYIASRFGDPTLLHETETVNRLFKVLKVENVYKNYGNSSPTQPMWITAKTILDKLGLVNFFSDTEDMAYPPEFFGNLISDSGQKESALMTDKNKRAAIMAVVVIFLSSMGLKLVPGKEPNSPCGIESDDPEIDYGYGKGAAIIARTEGWLNVSCVDETSEEVKHKAAKSVCTILLSLASLCIRSLVANLFSFIIGEYSSRANIRVNNCTPKDVCVHTVVASTTPIYGRLMNAFSVYYSDTKFRKYPDKFADKELCYCGTSLAKVPITVDEKTAAIKTWYLCPFTLMTPRLGCKYYFSTKT
jgi:hypothetical protein